MSQSKIQAPDENGLKLMLENDLVEACQMTIDSFKLDYRIVQRDGKYILQDMVVALLKR